MDDEEDHSRSDGGRGGQKPTESATRTRQRENGVSAWICCSLFAPKKVSPLIIYSAAGSNE